MRTEKEVLEDFKELGYEIHFGLEKVSSLLYNGFLWNCISFNHNKKMCQINSFISIKEIKLLNELLEIWDWNKESK